MRRKFTMTSDQQKAIIDASKPVPYMVIGSNPPRSPQENANYAWQSLAKELGFVWHTARPVPGESSLVFEAEVSQ